MPATLHQCQMPSSSGLELHRGIGFDHQESGADCECHHAEACALEASLALEANAEGSSACATDALEDAQDNQQQELCQKLRSLLLLPWLPLQDRSPHHRCCAEPFAFSLTSSPSPFPSPYLFPCFCALTFSSCPFCWTQRRSSQCWRPLSQLPHQSLRCWLRASSFSTWLPLQLSSSACSPSSPSCPGVALDIRVAYHGMAFLVAACNLVVA
mmetsp:Transcript_7003/g.15343  ORF Transcript_7003/g.15343 Transcript_7003/m.15343 type:complete len:212 (-) Transcript_7003:295-930(-)